MRKLLPVVVLLAAAVLGYAERDRFVPHDYGHSQTPDATSVLADAYRKQLSDLQVAAAGEVIKLLPDDDVGSRHQRFLLRLDSGQTLLIAHNIDLAPRINSLRVGDRVAFNGEYEWNEHGGVIHWTHHDPAGRHEAGWLKHNGRTYQ